MPNNLAVTLWSFKGGVGKSTIALTLAEIAAASGLRVLAVDIDEAPEEVIQAAREGTISIHRTYTAIKPPKSQKTYWDSLIRHAEKTAREGKNIDAVISLLNQALDILKSAQ